MTTVSADTGGLRPDLWQAIFSASTFVEKFTVGDFAQRLMVSYPTRDALAFLKNAYQRIGSGTDALTERSACSRCSRSWCSATATRPPSPLR